MAAEETHAGGEVARHLEGWRTAEELAREEGRGAFKEHRLSLVGLDRPLRIFLYAVFAQTAIAAVLLATQGLSQPLVDSGVVDQSGGTYAVPTVDLVVAALSLPLGYCLVLAAALRIRPGAGLAIVAAVTAVLAVVPVAKLGVGGPDVGQHAAEVWMRKAQLGVLGLMWLWVLGRAAVVRWSAHRRAREEHGGQQQSADEPEKARWRRTAFFAAVGAIVAYYVLEFGVWGSYAQQGKFETGSRFLLDDLSIQTVLLPLFLGFVLLLGSADLLEWGQTTVRRAVAVVRPAMHDQPESEPESEPVTGLARVRARAFLVLTPLASIAVIYNEQRFGMRAAAVELLVLAVPAGVLWLLLRRVAGYAEWSDELRSSAVYAGAIAVFAATSVLQYITSEISSTLNLSGWLTDELYWLVAAPTTIVLLTAGTVLLLRSRPRPRQAEPDATERAGRLKALGLFLVVTGTLTLIPMVLNFLPAVGVSVFLPSGFYVLNGIQLVAALASFVWIIRQFVLRRAAQAASIAARLFVMLASLQAISLILNLLNRIAVLSTLSTTAMAGLFLGVGAWGLVTSGSDLNADQPAHAPYPRDGRIMLLAGYILIANATLIYLGTLRTPGTGTPAADYLTSDFTTPLGLNTFCPILVLLTFFLYKRHAAAHKESGTGAESGSGSGSGAIATPKPRAGNQKKNGTKSATALFAVLILGLTAACGTSSGSAKPGADSINQPYSAATPGPNCDTGGGDWSVPPGQATTATCLKTGLQISVGAQGAGEVQFLPPAGRFTANYTASVHVDIRGLTDGCAGIYTRASSSGQYSADICSDSATGTGTTTGTRIYAWNIQRTNASASPWLLGTGELGASNGDFTLTASTDGSNQQIAVGNSTASATDANISTTRYIALGISNSGSQRAMVLFSDFTFTPLANGATGCCSADAALPVTAQDKDDVWFTDTGKTELTQLSAQLETIGNASGSTAQVAACTQLGTLVATQQQAASAPEPAVQASFSGALADLAQASTDCVQGVPDNNQTLLNQYAAEVHNAVTDLEQVKNAMP